LEAMGGVCCKSKKQNWAEQAEKELSKPEEPVVDCPDELKE